MLIHTFFCENSHSPSTVDCSIYNFLSLKVKQAMAEQGHTQSLSPKLNLKMNWDGQLGLSVAKLGLNKNRVDI